MEVVMRLEGHQNVRRQKHQLWSWAIIHIFRSIAYKSSPTLSCHIFYHCHFFLCENNSKYVGRVQMRIFEKTQSQWKLIRIFAASLVLSQLHLMSRCYSTWVSHTFAFSETHNDPHLCHITGLVCLRLPSHAAALLVTPNVTSTSRLPGTTDRFSHNTFSNFSALDKIHHFFWQPDFSFPLVFQKHCPKEN